ALETWGSELKAAHVRIVMDSLPAARNLIKGGGPVTELSNIVKAIWRQAHERGFTYVVSWVERERNAVADQLSKRWERWHALTPEALARIRVWMAGMGVDLTIVNPPFNQIKDTIQAARYRGHQICVAHPRWPAQAWWPAIREGVSLDLGWARDVLCEKEDGPYPNWRMWVSVLNSRPVAIDEGGHRSSDARPAS